MNNGKPYVMQNHDGTLTFHNGDGTYNGLMLMSALTGLSMEEVTWTAKRVKELIVEQKIAKEEAMKIIKIEAKSKPWQQPPTQGEQRVK